MLTITPQIGIDETELVETFVRASGPGGQNVNKVATAVQLRFDVRNSPSLPEPVRQRLMEAAGSQLTADGVLIIRASQYRTQERNRQAARERLRNLILSVVRPPTARHATRPTHASRQRRIQSKRQRSGTKAGRRPVTNDGE